MPVVVHPSANFGPRRDGQLPDLIVLHYTAMATAEAALERLCDPAYEVSAHYLISETGVVYQLVDERMRAWHAGAGQWGDVRDVNSRSIGIELANDGAAPFSEPQMQALEVLLAGIMGRWAIVPERVIGHSDMAPQRKQDPGRKFDWRRLARQGGAVWPTECAGPPPDRKLFSDLLATAGYDCKAGHGALLAAFRLRFSPWKLGALDDGDLRRAQALALQFPVDRGSVSA